VGAGRNAIERRLTGLEQGLERGQLLLQGHRTTPVCGARSSARVL
jgi:hypothetical protein